MTHEVSKCRWKNGAGRLAWHRIAINLQSVKNTVSVKCNKAKCSEMRYAHTVYIHTPTCTRARKVLVFLVFHLLLCGTSNRVMGCPDLIDFVQRPCLGSSWDLLTLWSKSSCKAGNGGLGVDSKSQFWSYCGECENLKLSFS